MARSYCEANSFNLYFWRDKQVEVDLVIDKKTHLLPVEVKYRNKIKPEDVAGLRVFMDKYALKTGLVITKNTLREEGGIYYVPFRWIRALGQ
jgi:predicted AAA+ superfamily ATPase